MYDIIIYNNYDIKLFIQIDIISYHIILLATLSSFWLAFFQSLECV